MAEEQKNVRVRKMLHVLKVGLKGLAVMAVAALLGVCVYWFLLAPMMEPAEGGEDAAGPDKIPSAVIMADFSEMRATVQSGDSNTPALLQYSVSLACANEKTALLVEERRQLFQAMLVKLHDARTKEELNDPVAKDSVLRQAKQEANVLLKRIQEQEDPSVEIIEGMYTEYTVIDL